MLDPVWARYIKKEGDKDREEGRRETRTGSSDPRI